METPAKKIEEKTPNKPYKDALEFPETGEVSLFKKKSTRLLLSIGLDSLRIGPIICVVRNSFEPTFGTPVGSVVSANTVYRISAVYPALS